jgi:heat shock protein HslJ
MQIVRGSRAWSRRSFAGAMGVAVLAVLGASACDPPAPPGNAQEPGGAELMGAAWRLASLKPEQGGGAERTPASAAETYTAEFAADGMVGGQAHCNQYSGRYRTGAAGALTIGDLNATLMACAAPSIAGEYVGALARVTAYRIEDGELRLAFGNGGELVFERSREAQAAAR